MLTALVSASGAPGVTTTALALALHWPRPVVLVEADASGSPGLLAGYFRGQLDPPGLVDLVLAQRSELLAETVPRLLTPLDGADASVLFGLRSHQQAAGAAALWLPLLTVLQSLTDAGTDVLVDVGRLGSPGSPRPLIASADVVLLVGRSDLPGLAGARSWATALASEATPGQEVRMLLVGEDRPYSRREVAKTLGLPVLGAVEWSPEPAQVYSHGMPFPPVAWWRRIGRGADAARDAFEDSRYIRSVRAVAEVLSALAELSVPASRGGLSDSGVLVEGRSLA